MIKISVSFIAYIMLWKLLNVKHAGTCKWKKAKIVGLKFTREIN